MLGVSAGPAPVPFTANFSDEPRSLAPLKTPDDPFAPLDTFARRHIGPNPEEVAEMLEQLGYKSLEALVQAVVPRAIRLERPMELPAPRSESAALEELRLLMKQNKVFRSL